MKPSCDEQMRTTCKVDRNFTVKAEGGLEEIGAEVEPRVRHTGNDRFDTLCDRGSGVFESGI